MSRHLFEATDDRNYAILAKLEGKAAVVIVKKSGFEKGLGTALYNLAKSYQTLGKIEKEREAIEEALEVAKDDISFTSEMKTRLSAIEYGEGDDKAKVRFEKAVSDLQTNPHPDEYTQNVWLSGAYLHMAEALLKRGEKHLASGEILKAENIIGDDEKYKLRRGQIEKLKEQI